MATYYVDDAAVGLNDGSSWTDAWTSIVSAETVAAGSEIRVASTHDETGAGTYNPDFSVGTNALPIRVISSTTGDVYSSRGATIRGTTGLIIAGCVEFYGVYLDSGTGDFFACDDPSEDQKYIDCYIKVGDGVGDDFYYSAGQRSRVWFVDCTIDCADQIGVSNASDTYAYFINCDFISTGGQTSLIAFFSASTFVEFIGCDLSDWTTIIDGTALQWQSVVVKDCLLGGNTLYGGTTVSGVNFIIERCTSDTDLSIPPLPLQELIQYEGTVKAVSTKYRTNGASDGYQNYSFEMITNADALEAFRPLYTPWITGWLNSGSKTLYFYMAGSTTLYNDDVAVEIFHGNESAASTTRAAYRNTVMTPLATPSAIATDSSSSWVGTGVGTKQQISFKVSPDISGPFKFRFALYKPSTTLYIDPKRSEV